MLSDILLDTKNFLFYFILPLKKVDAGEGNIEGE